jgi:amidophosphoribosyltransferase
MCGIVGVISQTAVCQSIYDALTIVQHRGQDAAGIMTCDQGKFNLRKSNGLVRDVIQKRHMERLKGNMGIGHVRYPTAGSETPAESQPFYVNSPFGLSIVHNGNIVNSVQLEQELKKADLRHLNTHSDSEVLLNVFAHELQTVATENLTIESLFKAVSSLHSRVVGAYAVILMINGYGLLAFRDPHGIRPLVVGERKVNNESSFMFASETVPLDVLGFDSVSDIEPGEAVFIDLQGEVHRQQCADNPQLNPCIFEYIYLARPDSVLDNIPVYRSRLGMGETLGKKIKRLYPEHDIDVVIPIPDTSRTSAIALAQELELPYCEGFVKNRYIGRTFIMPEQALRRSSVRLKLNTMREEFAGKNVLLVDDSIVRGTTSREIVQMARDAGANRVYFASAAPEVRYPNVYGIDMPDAEELIAHNKTVDEVAQLIGADWLVYQDLVDAVDAINAAAKHEKNKITRFEDSIFTGEYVTGGVDEAYLARVASLRADSAKADHSLADQNEQECGISNEE